MQKNDPIGLPESDKKIRLLVLLGIRLRNPDYMLLTRYYRKLSFTDAVPELSITELQKIF